MFKIAALNESECEDDTSGGNDKAVVSTTKEAKEAEAFSLYREALGLQEKGEAAAAESLYTKLIQHPFLQQAAELVEEEVIENPSHPGLQLLYSIYKNLAVLASQRGDSKASIEAYLEAVKIDETEVTVWYKIGVLATELFKYPLAKLAFGQGLKYNPNHWLCLDQMISMCYALNDYWPSLYYIGKALQKDMYYNKGLALREAMYREQPSLKRDTEHMFQACDPAINSIKIEEEDINGYVAEAEVIREKIREQCKLPPIPMVKLTKPITTYTWRCVGESFLALLEAVEADTNAMAMVGLVDLSDYQHAVADFGPIELSSASSSSDSMQAVVPMDVSESLLPPPAPLASQTPLPPPSASQGTSLSEVKGERGENREEGGKLTQGAGMSVTRQETPSAGNPLGTQDSLPVKMEVDELVTNKVIGGSGQLVAGEAQRVSSMGGASGTEGKPYAATPAAVADLAPETSQKLGGSPSDVSTAVVSAMTTVPQLQSSPLPVTAGQAVPSTAVSQSAAVFAASKSSLPSEATTSQVAPMSPVPGASEAGLLADPATTPLVSPGVPTNHSTPNSTPGSALSPTPRPTPTSSLPGLTSTVQSTPVSCLSSVLSVTPHLASSVSSQQVSGIQDSSLTPSASCSNLSTVTPSPSLQAPPSILSPYSTSSTPTARPTVAAASQPLSHFTDPNRPRLMRRGPKRKQHTLPEEAGGKRRSARVRNTAQRKEESINFQEMLQQFLPSSLKNQGEREEDVLDDSSQTTGADSQTAELGEAGEEGSMVKTEELDVRAFVQGCIQKGAALGLLYRFIHKLGMRSLSAWPAGLAALYVQIFNRIRKSIMFRDCPLSNPAKKEELTENVNCVLTWAELAFDQWLAAHAKSQSPGNTQRGGLLSTPTLMEEAFGNFHYGDFVYLAEAYRYPDIHGDNDFNFCLRVLWFFARLRVLENESDTAVGFFVKILDMINAQRTPSFQLKLPNCQVDNLISISSVKMQMESLQRCLYLEETQKLFESGQYQQVVDILLLTFSRALPSRKMTPYGSAMPERHAQLLLLQESLLKLGDLEKCLKWGEASLNEALHHYRLAGNSQDRTEWASTLSQICEGLDSVLTKDCGTLRSLASPLACRLSQNLIQMIELTMDVGDGVTDMPIPSVLPWILLYRLIKHEEDKLEAMRVRGENEGGEPVQAISSSLMLLKVAHQHLGRHAWCTRSKGSLLLFAMEVLQRELNTVSANFREDLELALEQCIYCLYGYPSKKTKARRLVDHNAPPISLSWEKAGPVFEFFKPKTVAEFDSYKTSTVSADLESFLRRIFVVIPEDLSVGTRVDEVHAYINGESDKPPAYHTDHPILMDLHYLLADYYFKNKEPTKAIKFYTNDLCVNSGRLDSWAGLALAIMSQLEQKLSSMELKMDVPIHKKAIASLRCFRRALEIDETTKKLWIEYGSLAYQLHSHASRQLKLHKWLPLGEELLEIAGKMREDMLAVAQNCYWKASECEAEGCEEEWLHHYMMGKVKEKKGLPPKDILEHYHQAALYLHEDGATYPKKIAYGQYSPHLAVEALEVYYRLHACILKELAKENGDVDLRLFLQYVNEAASSPFACGKEKKNERSDSVSVEESSCSEAATPAAPKQRPVFHMTPPDHPYSRQKSSQDGLEGDSASSQRKDSHSMDDFPVFRDLVQPRVVASDVRLGEAERKSAMETEDKEVEVMEVVADNEVELSQSSVAGDRQTGAEANRSRLGSGEKKPMQAGQGRAESAMEVDEDVQSLPPQSWVRPTPDAAGGSSNPQSQEKSPAHRSQSPRVAETSSKSKEHVTEDPPGSLNKQRSGGFDVSGLIGTGRSGEHQQQQSDRGKDRAEGKGEGEKAGGKVELDEVATRQELVDKCIQALHLCLKRFPTHYKSLYRLAHFFFSSSTFKNLQFARDLLLGNPSWQQLTHMPCPGLFAERRHVNFFQGLWRIPVEEVDRAGSFPSHVQRSVQLLLEVLREQKDMKMLFFIHTQLLRTPDTGKKYLRDCERVILHRRAFDYAARVAEKLTEEMQDEEDDAKLLRFLMEVYRIWSHGTNKLALKEEHLDEMLAEAFAVARKNWEIDISQPLLEQAIKFCQEQQQADSSRSLSVSQDEKSSSTVQMTQSRTSKAAAMESTVEGAASEREPDSSTALGGERVMAPPQPPQPPAPQEEESMEDSEDEIILLDSPDTLTAEIKLLLSGENC